jgi:hypothetical protein
MPTTATNTNTLAVRRCIEDQAYREDSEICKLVGQKCVTHTLAEELVELSLDRTSEGIRPYVGCASPKSHPRVEPAISAVLDSWLRSEENP